MLLKIIGKLIYNSILGLILLLVVNVMGGYFNFHIPFNVFTVLIAGFLGIPGTALLALLKFMYIGGF